jgi:hypothetical protein
VNAGEECVGCGLEASGRHGLPVDDSGRIVHNGYEGDWVGQPACEGCHMVHAAGGPDVLEAHVKATELLRRRVVTALATLNELAGDLEDRTSRAVDEALEAIR